MMMNDEVFLMEFAILDLESRDGFDLEGLFSSWVTW